jgi:hypothetical protein
MNQRIRYLESGTPRRIPSDDGPSKKYLLEIFNKSPDGWGGYLETANIILSGADILHDAAGSERAVVEKIAQMIFNSYGVSYYTIPNYQTDFRSPLLAMSADTHYVTTIDAHKHVVDDDASVHIIPLSVTNVVIDASIGEKKIHAWKGPNDIVVWENSAHNCDPGARMRPNQNLTAPIPYPGTQARNNWDGILKYAGLQGIEYNAGRPFNVYGVNGPVYRVSISLPYLLNHQHVLPTKLTLDCNVDREGNILLGTVVDGTGVQSQSRITVYGTSWLLTATGVSPELPAGATTVDGLGEPKFFKGNTEKQEFINGAPPITPSQLESFRTKNPNSLDFWRCVYAILYVLCKELGDLMQVLILKHCIDEPTEASFNNNNCCILTIDSYLFLRSMLFQVPCLYYNKGTVSLCMTVDRKIQQYCLFTSMISKILRDNTIYHTTLNQDIDIIKKVSGTPGNLFGYVNQGSEFQNEGVHIKNPERVVTLLSKISSCLKEANNTLEELLKNFTKGKLPQNKVIVDDGDLAKAEYSVRTFIRFFCGQYLLHSPRPLAAFESRGGTNGGPKTTISFCDIPKIFGNKQPDRTFFSQIFPVPSKAAPATCFVLSIMLLLIKRERYSSL